MSIIPFPQKSHDTLLRAMEGKNWDYVFGWMQSNGYTDLTVERLDVAVAVLQAWSYHHDSEKGHVPPIPVNFQDQWISGSHPEMNGASRLTWLARFGQWRLAFMMLERGDRSCPLLWDFAIRGYMERNPTIARQVYLNDGTSATHEHMDARHPVSQTEEWQVLTFMALLKRTTKAPDLFYARNDLVRAIQSHVNHLSHAFFVNGSSFFPRQETKDDQGDCLINTAVLSNNNIVLKWMLSEGVRPLDLQRTMINALWLEDRSCLQTIFAECLTKDIEEHLPVLMMHAVSKSDIDMCELLLTHGAPIHVVSLEGYTFLHQAAFNGTLDMIVWLLEKGLSWEVKSHEGKTPKEMFQESQPLLHAQFFDNRRVIPFKQKEK